MTESRRDHAAARRPSTVQGAGSADAIGAAYAGPSVVRFSGYDRSLVDAVELETFKSDIRTAEDAQFPISQYVKTAGVWGAFAAWFDKPVTFVLAFVIFFLFALVPVVGIVALAGVMGVVIRSLLRAHLAHRRKRKAARLRLCEFAFSPQHVLVRVDGELVRSFEVPDIVRFSAKSQLSRARALLVVHADGTTSDLPVNAGSYEQLLDIERQSNEILEESKVLAGRPFR